VDGYYRKRWSEWEYERVCDALRGRMGHGIEWRKEDLGHLLIHLVGLE